MDGGVALAHHNAGPVRHHEIPVDLLAVEMADVLRCQLQRGAEVRIQGGPGSFDFLRGDFQIRNFRPVKPAGIGPEGLVSTLPDAGENFIHGGADVGLGLNVPVEDLIRGEVGKLVNGDHPWVTSASFSSSRSISWRLN